MREEEKEVEKEEEKEETRQDRNHILYSFNLPLMYLESVRVRVRDPVLVLDLDLGSLCN